MQTPVAPGVFTAPSAPDPGRSVGRRSGSAVLKTTVLSGRFPLRGDTVRVTKPGCPTGVTRSSARPASGASGPRCLLRWVLHQERWTEHHSRTSWEHIRSWAVSRSDCHHPPVSPAWPVPRRDPSPREACPPVWTVPWCGGCTLAHRPAPVRSHLRQAEGGGGLPRTTPDVGMNPVQVRTALSDVKP